MEYLAPRKEPKIEVIKEAFAGTDLQVVLTARDLARSPPAMWTESTQNRGVRTCGRSSSLRRQCAPRNRRRCSRKPGAMVLEAPAPLGHRVTIVPTPWAPSHFTLITVPPAGAPPGIL